MLTKRRSELGIAREEDMNLKYVSDAPGAPGAIGPYSQAVEAGGLIFLSGQIGLEPKSGVLVSGEVAAQTRQVMANLKAVLASLGLSFASVVKSTIYLADLSHFGVVNEVYEVALGGVKPARATLQVSALPKGALVEIEMVAMR